MRLELQIAPLHDAIATREKPKIFFLSLAARLSKSSKRRAPQRRDAVLQGAPDLRPARHSEARALPLGPGAGIPRGSGGLGPFTAPGRAQEPYGRAGEIPDFELRPPFHGAAPFGSCGGRAAG